MIIINSILINGGVLVSDQKVGSDNLLIRNIILSKEKCNIKISYINIGDKQFLTQKICSCYNLSWISIPQDCLKNKLNVKKSSVDWNFFVPIWFSCSSRNIAIFSILFFSPKI